MTDTKKARKFCEQKYGGYITGIDEAITFAAQFAASQVQEQRDMIEALADKVEGNRLLSSRTTMTRSEAAHVIRELASAIRTKGGNNNVISD